jgi:hypothetical protein
MDRPDFRDWVRQGVRSGHVLIWYNEQHVGKDLIVRAVSLSSAPPADKLALMWTAASAAGLPFPTLEEARAAKKLHEDFHVAMNSPAEVGDLFKEMPVDSEEVFWEVTRILLDPEDLVGLGKFFSKEHFPMLVLKLIGGEEKVLLQVEATLGEGEEGTSTWVKYPRAWLHLFEDAPELNNRVYSQGAWEDALQRFESPEKKDV